MKKAIKSTANTDIPELIKVLCSDNGMKRKKARKALVDIGKDSIVPLMALLSNPKHIIRREALKTLSEIGEPELIPLFITTLENDKSDMRWISAEGLIKLGVFSLEPLLKTLIEKSDSIFILAGAHHILLELRDNGMLPKDLQVNKLLSALKNPGWFENVVPLAYEMLNEIKKRFKFLNKA